MNDQHDHSLTPHCLHQAIAPRTQRKSSGCRTGGGPALGTRSGPKNGVRLRQAHVEGAIARNQNGAHILGPAAQKKLATKTKYSQPPGAPSLPARLQSTLVGLTVASTRYATAAESAAPTWTAPSAQNAAAPISLASPAPHRPSENAGGAPPPGCGAHTAPGPLRCTAPPACHCTPGLCDALRT